MKTISIASLLFLLASCSSTHTTSSQHLPRFIKGSFADDYGIEYSINDSAFIQRNIAKYHIIESNAIELYLITRNDSSNVYSKGMYTRIDYMQFENMDPYTWGYCLTIYNAPDVATARNAKPADRSTPKTGCNGYPFSRMKKL